jgi:hypothetical protein
MDFAICSLQFKTVHISGKSNVVADCLTRQFEDLPEQSFAGLVPRHLPAAFQSIRQPQIKDSFCREMYEKIERQDPNARNYGLVNYTIVYVSSRKKVQEIFSSSGLKIHVVRVFS